MYMKIFIAIAVLQISTPALAVKSTVNGSTPSKACEVVLTAVRQDLRQTSEITTNKPEIAKILGKDVSSIYSTSTSLNQRAAFVDTREGESYFVDIKNKVSLRVDWNITSNVKAGNSEWSQDGRRVLLKGFSARMIDISNFLNGQDSVNATVPLTEMDPFYRTGNYTPESTYVNKLALSKNGKMVFIGTDPVILKYPLDSLVPEETVRLDNTFIIDGRPCEMNSLDYIFKKFSDDSRRLAIVSKFYDRRVNETMIVALIYDTLSGRLLVAQKLTTVLIPKLNDRSQLQSVGAQLKRDLGWNYAAMSREQHLKNVKIDFSKEKLRITLESQDLIVGEYSHNGATAYVPQIPGEIQRSQYSIDLPK